MILVGSNANEQFVLDFLKLWADADLEGLVSAFTEDAIYHDLPYPPRRGIDQIREFLEFALTAMETRIEVLRIASHGNVVFTERIEHLHHRWTGRSMELPLAGVFELSGGRIAAWREYFDGRAVEEGLMGASTQSGHHSLGDERFFPTS